MLAFPDSDPDLVNLSKFQISLDSYMSDRLAIQRQKTDIVLPTEGMLARNNNSRTCKIIDNTAQSSSCRLTRYYPLPWERSKVRGHIRQHVNAAKRVKRVKGESKAARKKGQAQTICGRYADSSQI